MLMMCVTFCAVVMRYMFNAPILGGNEVIQLLSVAVVFLAMPYATQTEAHIRVDVLDHLIGPYGRFFGDLLSRSLSIIVISFLVHRMWLKTLDSLEYEDATNMLNIPLWPFYGLILLGMAIFVLLLATQILDIWLKGATDNE